MTAIHTRCRPGDIALVTKEEPGCEINIGRLVIVQSHFIVDPELGLMWEIATFTEDPWTGFQGLERGSYLRLFQIGQTHHDRSVVYQADKWLMPIRAPETDNVGLTLEPAVSPAQAPTVARKKGAPLVVSQATVDAATKPTRRKSKRGESPATSHRAGTRTP